ncbi:MAG: RNA-binding S4 domain-containing protein [Pseudomonadota bacterium]
MIEPQKTQRLDKWLWHARFVKTRSLAQKLISTGNVRIDRQKITSSSKPVKIGNVLTVSLSGKVRVVEILGLASRRGPFVEASQLYQEKALGPEETRAPTKKPIREIVVAEARPDKKDRRKAIKMKQNYPWT